MIWVILKADDGSIIITSNKEKAMLYTQASIINGEPFKVIPYDDKKDDLYYYNF